MKKHSLTLMFAALAASFFAGCASVDHGVSEKVTVTSEPSGASVYINGDPIGTTPLDVKLPRKMTHEVRLEKEGFQPTVKYFSPVSTGKDEQLVRFGPVEDLGLYHTLEPQTMQAELKSNLVPNSVGADPSARMAQKVLEADRRLEAGQISPAEHKLIVEQIIRFFEQNT